MGPVGFLRVLIDPWIGLPFRLVSRPALADDSVQTLRTRRLSDHPLGHEGEQFRLPHRSSRRRAESHFHGTLPARPPSHVLRRCSHAALHAPCAWLLVGAAGLPPRHPSDRPPPPQRRKNASPRPPRLFRILPSHPLPPPPPTVVVSFQKSGFCLFLSRLGGTASPGCALRPSPCIPTAKLALLLPRLTRKRPRQRNRGYVTGWTVRLPRIFSKVFLNDANDLDHGHSAGHAGHSVPSRNTQQLLVHEEAIGKACNPAQTGGIAPNAGSVFVPFTVDAGTDFQKVPARSADIRLLRRALLSSADRRTKK